jgi:hypothetical protein
MPDLVECSFDVEEDTYGALPRLECLVVGLKFYKGVVSGALCTKVKLFGGKKIVSFECEFEAIVKILSKILPVMLRSEMER